MSVREKLAQMTVEAAVLAGGSAVMAGIVVMPGCDSQLHTWVDGLLYRGYLVLVYGFVMVFASLLIHVLLRRHARRGGQADPYQLAAFRVAEYVVLALGAGLELLGSFGVTLAAILYHRPAAVALGAAMMAVATYTFMLAARRVRAVVCWLESIFSAASS